MICGLLPARNAAEDLPGYLEAAPSFCDAIVALDDGSRDGTADVLEASPLIRTLLRSPPRESYRGWDDAANRNLLLDAAAALQPDWIISIDADERMDPDDAAALRSFLASGDALPGCAYGLRLFRMWGAGSYDPAFRWVYRLFAWSPGQSFPDRRLHFDPVPDSIPLGARVRTTLRIRHLGAMDRERIARRRAKYREADPWGAFGPDPTDPATRPLGPLPRWGPRPERLSVLDPASLPPEPERESGAAGAGERSRRRPQGPLLVCLLAARNCAGDLPGWFESARRCCDAVVALDDGSSDRTAEALEAEPLVRLLLRNPPRTGYAGWDDAQNRQRLLDAAIGLDPHWVLWLDADERLDAADAAALRAFVKHEAVPGDAYGFKVFRMVGDGDAYDRADLWAYRLFAPEPGHRLPDQRLHLVPIPPAIPRERWRPTTVRIQHLAGLTEERRREQFAKYREADPANRWQRDYTHVLDPPAQARPWPARPRDFPALADPLGRDGPDALDLHELDLEGPVASVVVIARDEADELDRALRAVSAQRCPAPFEVIAVVSGSPTTASIVRERFPEVALVELAEAALPGRARNAGLRIARGDYVTFPGAHIELPPGSLAARLRAHEAGHALVTGATLNGTRTPAGWASYFLDHATTLPGRPSGPLGGPPGNCSYVRELVLAAGGFPEDMRTGEDTVVNRELWRRGYDGWLDQHVRIVHHSPCRTPARLIAHHFRRGCGMGRILVADQRGSGPLLRSRTVGRFLRPYPRRRLRRTDAALAAWGGDLERTYRRVRPLVVAGVVAAWLGGWWEALRPARRRQARTGS